MTLQHYLLQLKERHNTPFQAIADATGISKGTLSQITAGRTKSPDPDTLRRLAIFFGKSEAEVAAIYEEFMNRAGYLDGLPQFEEPDLTKEALEVRKEMLRLSTKDERVAFLRGIAKANRPVFDTLLGLLDAKPQSTTDASDIDWDGLAGLVAA